MLKAPSVFAMNSRRTRGVRGGLDWLLATRALVFGASETGRVIVAGLGLDLHEAAAQGAAEAGAAMIVALEGPVPGMLEETRRAAFYDRNRGLYTYGKTLWISVFPPGSPRLPKEVSMATRDALAAGIASMAVAVSVRSGGRMERLALARLAAGMPVEILPCGCLPAKVRDTLEKRGARIASAVWSLRTGGSPGSATYAGPVAAAESKFDAARPHGAAESGRMKPPGEALLGSPASESWEDGSPEEAGSSSEPRPRSAASGLLSTVPSPGELRRGWDFLAHYTRAFRGPFPGQSRAEYIRDLAALGRPRNGMDTLRRILAEGRIRASGRLIRGGEAAVSLTALSPWEAAEVAGWCPHLVRWSFEPYAVCIRREAAEAAGIEPVLYLPEDCFGALPEDRRFLFQKHRPPDCDWTREKEWRRRGDIVLPSLAPEAVLVLTRTAEEADSVRRDFNLAAIGIAELGIRWP